MRSIRTLTVGLLAGFLISTVLGPTFAIVQEALPLVAKACLMNLARAIDPEPTLDDATVPEPPLIGSAVDVSPLEQEVTR